MCTEATECQKYFCEQWKAVINKSKSKEFSVIIVFAAGECVRIGCVGAAEAE